MFDEAEIQKVCGVIETNGFEVPELNLVALYGHGYLLEHSCIPNTTRTFDARLHLVVTASLDIKAGEHITTSYIDPLCGERIRTVHLLKFKHFTCTCPRCLDPTDLGTHLSSVKCKFCSEGFLIPSRDIAIPWKCNCCAGHSEAQQVEETLVELFKLKENLSPTTAALEKYLRETSQWLSENHHFRLEVKLALLQMYGRGREEAKISEEDIRRKRHLCEQVLEVANVVVPGLSRIRGVLLYELQSTYTQEFKRMHKKLKNSDYGKDLIQKAEETLEDALTILKMETHLKDEMQMIVQGNIDIKFIKEWKESLLKKENSSKKKDKKKL